MRRKDFCRGWTFRIWGVPGDTPVTLPHDLSAVMPRSADSRSGSAGGWFRGANLIYDREIEAGPEEIAGRVMLEFEGVLPGAEVYLDDTLLTRQPYGYLSFLVDLTGRLRPGKQHLRVNVHGDALPNSRWYVGCGICRPVALLESGPACVLPRGLTYRTEREGEQWRLDARVRLSDEAAEEGNEVCLTLLGEKGEVLWRKREQVRGTEVKCAGPVPSVRSWSPDSPVLYRLTAELRAGERVLDAEETFVGFREVGLDASRGFLLNGKPFKLRGGCVHHDNGILGALSLPEAEYRKALRLKNSGFNAVRCAHNPPAPSFLDACDHLGLVVMDEFTDVWNIGKNPYDYHLFFRDRWEADLRDLVERDRNHPCVLLWSIGNEIPERDGAGDGYALCARMSRAVRDADDTRLVTCALNNIGRRRLEMLAANVQAEEAGESDPFGVLSEPFLEPLDVAGYNYLSRRYAEDLKNWPRRFICGTESVAKEALDSWQKTLDHPRVIGDFAWAAIDYLGEAGIGHAWRRPEDGEGFFEKWPWRQANCGDMDLWGEMNPAGYYRRAVWGTLEAPRIAVQHPEHFRDDGEVSYWGWPERHHAWDYPGYEGKSIHLEVYSPGGEITLLLNGREAGRAPSRDCAASFDLLYAPGTLEAVDEKGRRDILFTPSGAARVRLEAEQVGDTAFLTAVLTDEKGTECAFDARTIAFHCEGCTLLAVGSADPSSEEGFGEGRARAWRGRVHAVVRGEGRVTVRAGGLEEVCQNVGPARAGAGRQDWIQEGNGI